MPKMKSIKPNMGMPMGAGTPVVFNAYHYHNVFNYDLDTSRLTIRFFADLKEDNVYDLIEEAVNSYEGNYVG